MGEEQTRPSGVLLRSEDAGAMLIAMVWLGVSLLAVLASVGDSTGGDAELVSPLKGWGTEPGGWTSDLSVAFFPREGGSFLPGIAAVFFACLVLFAAAVQALERAGISLVLKQA
ncbi:MAG: hypothetical protein HY000_13100 [Planctomycetes bacterium]|nr:hypothetical protein [Planctomycetota bacterium]